MKDYYTRTIVKEEIPSRYLDSPRLVKIYLPPGYNELVSYPVIYCQDGVEFFSMGRIATITNRLILDEGMEPVIIVGVTVERSKRTSEYSPVGSRHEAYKRFFVEEMLPYIEQRYPVRREPQYRLLAGDSLGATVSLHTILDYPGPFTKLLSLSGAYFQPTLQRLQQAGSLADLDIWMMVGLDEQEVETHIGTYNFVQWNRDIYQLLQQKRAQVHYVERPGDHTWGLWQNVLPDALRYFYLPSS